MGPQPSPKTLRTGIRTGKYHDTANVTVAKLQCPAVNLAGVSQSLSEDRFSMDVLLEARGLRSEALAYRGKIYFRGKMFE